MFGLQRAPKRKAVNVGRGRGGGKDASSVILQRKIGT